MKTTGDLDVASIRTQLANGWNLRLSFLRHWCPQGARAVDLGARFGEYTLPLAEIASHVDALDMNPKYLDVLDHFTREAGIENVTTSSQDFISWSKGKQSTYDFCLCTGTWYYLKPPQRLAYLNTLRRLLTANGTLLVDFCADRYFLYRTFVQRLPLKLRLLSLLAFFYRRLRRKYVTEQIFEREAEAQGFKIIGRVGESYYACREYEHFDFNTAFGKYWSAYALRKD